MSLAFPLSASAMRAMMVLPVPWVSHGEAQSGKSETPVDLQFFETVENNYPSSTTMLVNKRIHSGRRAP
jgi:hypothetical protein